MTASSDLPTLPDLVDSHCHLDFPDFDGEVADLVARAEAAGVRRMVSICTKFGGLEKVRAISETHAGVYHAFGIHPMSVASEKPATVAELVEIAQHPKCVGIGETGLDYHYSAESAEAQKLSLRVHIEAAQETGLPLIIHARNADEDVEAILAEGMAKQSYGCVMHCFSSGPRLAEAALEMGFYLSMSGITAFPKSGDLREIFLKAPLERILVETDSPYLAPPPFRGRRNEPAYVAHTARKAAELFGLSKTDFAAQTTANFDRLFTKAKGVRHG